MTTTDDGLPLELNEELMSGEWSQDQILTVMSGDPKLLRAFVDTLYAQLGTARFDEERAKREQRHALRAAATALHTQGRALLDEAARLFEQAQL